MNNKNTTFDGGTAGWTRCPNCYGPRKNKKWTHEEGCIYYGKDCYTSILLSLYEEGRPLENLWIK